jgi:hypothetical protein
MLSLAKSTLLSVGLLAGAAFAAHAQSGSVAALPPGTAATPHDAAPVGPSAAYPGPKPGAGYYGGTVAQQRTVSPSPKYIGPNPGSGYYGIGSTKTTAGYGSNEAAHPYTAQLGPRPN